MSELNDFIQSQHTRDLTITAAIATMTQAQQDMTRRMFGGDGQKGAIDYIAESIADQRKTTGEIAVRVGTLETWRTGSIKWVAGAVAVLALEGTALGLYFSKIAGHVTAVITK